MRGGKAAAILAAAGALSLGAGCLPEYDTPLIKHLFTTTMVLWSGGWCLLLLAVFHVVFDILPRTAWLAYPFQVEGCNALLAYMLTNTPGLGVRSLWSSIAYPLFRWAEEPLLTRPFPMSFCGLRCGFFTVIRPACGCDVFFFIYSEK